MRDFSVAGLLTAATVALLLGGCATPADLGSSVIIHPTPPMSVIPADGDVLAVATVLEREGEAPNLCVGAVAESYPPQCGGPEIDGWDWAAVDGDETASGVTWGSYAVQGTWDGERFTVTQPPIMLALYDPPAAFDSHEDPANAGETEESRLLEIQAELFDSDTLEILHASPTNGYLFIGVVYDDGRIQQYLDDLYGPEVVVVQSALRHGAP